MNKMKKYWYTMMLIGSLIAVKGSSLIPRIWELETFSGEHKIERLAETEDKQPSNIPLSSDSISESAASKGSTETPTAKFPSPESSPAEPPTDGSAPEAPPVTESSTEAPPAETLPPTDTSVPVDLSTSLFIGDSRTEGLKEYGGLEEAEFFANSGMSSFNLLSTNLTVKDGSKKTLEELLSQHSYERIYLMLGINELGYPPSSVTKKYASIVDWIHQLQPQARIILEANLHVTKKKSDSDPVYGNGKIDSLNQAIYQMAVEKGCGYIDVNSLFDDGQGNLDSKYSVDNAHIMGKHYTVWAEWLRTQNA